MESTCCCEAEDAHKAGLGFSESLQRATPQPGPEPFDAIANIVNSIRAGHRNLVPLDLHATVSGSSRPIAYTSASLVSNQKEKTLANPTNSNHNTT